MPDSGIMAAPSLSTAAQPALTAAKWNGRGIRFVFRSSFVLGTGRGDGVEREGVELADGSIGAARGRGRQSGSGSGSGSYISHGYRTSFS